MKKNAVLGVFVVLMLADMAGIELSLTTGVSAKNLLLYVMAAWIMLDAALDTRGGGVLARPHDFLPLHLAFISLIVLAACSAVVCVLIVQHPGYTPAYGIIGLKTSVVDQYLMLFVFLGAIRDSNEGVWVVKGMIAVTTLGCIVSVADMFGAGLGIMTPRSDGRLQGPLGNSNDYAALMAFYLPITLGLALKSHRLERAFWLVATAINVLVIIFTTSRGALVALAAAGCAGALIMRRYVTTRYVVGVLMLFAAFVTIAVIVLAAQYEALLYYRFVEQQTGDQFELTSGRSMIWGGAMSLMMSAPSTLLTGFGLNSFNLLNTYASHNEYLEMTFNLGILGLILYLSVHALVLRHIVAALRRAVSDRRAVLMGYVFGHLTVLIAISFTNLSGVQLYMWAMAGTMLRIATDQGAIEPATRLARGRGPVGMARQGRLVTR